MSLVIDIMLFMLLIACIRYSFFGTISLLACARNIMEFIVALVLSVMMWAITGCLGDFVYANFMGYLP